MEGLLQSLVEMLLYGLSCRATLIPYGGGFRGKLTTILFILSVWALTEAIADQLSRNTAGGFFVT